jgi:outer membrane protein assembly factor BamB
VHPARPSRNPAPATALPRRSSTALIAALLCVLLSGSLAAGASGEPSWTTYHRDASRSGDDPEAPAPASPSLAWQTVDLGAPIWGQPLVLGSRVYVATVGDDVYALEATTGKVIWQKSLGTPVPASALPCGDIEPTVGVVGTPVIDPATGTLYAVADTWDATHEEAHHILEGLSLANGEEVVSIPVDPPGADPRALLQRTALNLDNGRVVFGFGGNDGDCSDYLGTVVSAPASGGTPLFWQVPIAPPATSGGAVWGPSGPAVDAAGDIYASTGNPDPPAGEQSTTFDYSDSVVKLDPAHDFVADPAHEAATPLGFFEPPSWLQDSNDDADLSSSGPELLPGGLLFQAGKNGTGYLIDEATMEAGAPAVYSAQVCGGHGSFGGDAFAAGVIYIACTDGTQALAYNQSARTFTPLWQGPSDAFGPPIVSGGLVWSIATGGFSGGGTTLYGLDPTSGVPRYTETLPSPVADHFASPSAAGGRLFLATGSSVSAYSLGSAAGTNTTTATPTSNTPGAAANLTTPSAIPTLAHRRLHATASGGVPIVLRCPAGAGASCRGTIALRTTITAVRGHGRRRRTRILSIVLARRSFGPAGGTIRLTLHLGRFARTLLARRHRHLALTVVIHAPGAPARSVPAVLS